MSWASSSRVGEAAASNPARIRKLQTLARGRGAWQLGVAPGHAAIVDGSSGAPLLVVQGDGLVRAVTMVEVSDAAAWNALLFDATARPVAPLQPGLPGTLRCRGAEIAEATGPAAKRLELRVEDGGDFSVLEQVEARWNQAMAVEGRVDFPDEDAALYAAAAAFARAAPWQYVDRGDRRSRRPSGSCPWRFNGAPAWRPGSLQARSQDRSGRQRAQVLCVRSPPLDTTNR